MGLDEILDGIGNGINTSMNFAKGSANWIHEAISDYHENKPNLDKYIDPLITAGIGASVGSSYGITGATIGAGLGLIPGSYLNYRDRQTKKAGLASYLKTAILSTALLLSPSIKNNVGRPIIDGLDNAKNTVIEVVQEGIETLDNYLGKTSKFNPILNDIKYQTPTGQKSKDLLSKIEQFDKKWTTDSNKHNTSAYFGQGLREKGRAHKGLDIPCERGSELKAMTYGKVIEAGFQGAKSNGWAVTYVTPNKKRIKYIHLMDSEGNNSDNGESPAIFVKPGDYVEPGTILSLCGNSGNASSNLERQHLHLQIQDKVKNKWKVVDPLNYFKNESNKEYQDWARDNSSILKDHKAKGKLNRDTIKKRYQIFKNG